MSKGKIIMTGASGFLGRAARRVLQERGYEAVLCDADLRDPDAVRKASLPEDAKAIVHLAARVDFSAALQPDLFRINTLASAALASFASRIGARFILASSVSAEAPASPYGLSKWLAEELAKEACLHWTALRFTGIFGRGGGSHLGLNRAIADALAGVAPALAGDGAGKRNYIFVEDAALVIAAALDADLQGLHVAGGETLSIREMLEAVCETLLPGSAPTRADGASSADQVFPPSSDLPATRPFRQALKDIKASAL